MRVLHLRSKDFVNGCLFDRREPINLRSMFVQGFPGAQRFFEQSLIFAAYDCVGGYLLAHMLLPLGVKPPTQSSGQFPVPFGVFPSSLFPLRRRGRRDRGNSSGRCHWALIRRSSPVSIALPARWAIGSTRIDHGWTWPFFPSFRERLDALSGQEVTEPAVNNLSRVRHWLTHVTGRKQSLNTRARGRESHISPWM